ncbi:MAG TPA: TetR family transcriptional regulator [Sphingobium sp.]|nr:TetR family transcriptional regulator [Sphingobium sp.]
MEENKLDRKQIVEAALALLQEEGIEKLSMRKLASRLAIRAPTLYWYFPDRSSILREIIKTLILEIIERTPRCDSWQGWLKAFGASLWETNRHTPYAMLLLQSAELNDETVVELATGLVERERQHYDVSREVFHRAYSDIQAYVLGWSVFHHSGVWERIDALYQIDQSIEDGIDGIVRIWEWRAAGK